MQQDSTSLAALIGSRICHDLINPIGAISNGLELVAMATPLSTSPEMTLIRQSCDNATARIRFFRIAFGTGDDTRSLPVTTARATLLDHFAGTRLRPDWETDTDMGRDVVQLGYLAALCLETALPQGGDIRITVTNRSLIAFAFGPVVQRDAALWSRLEAPDGAHPASLRPAHVQFALLARLCSASGRLPVVGFDSEKARMEIPLGLQDE